MPGAQRVDAGSLGEKPIGVRTITLAVSTCRVEQIEFVVLWWLCWSSKQRLSAATYQSCQGGFVRLGTLETWKRGPREDAIRAEDWRTAGSGSSSTHTGNVLKDHRGTRDLVIRGETDVPSTGVLRYNH